MRTCLLRNLILGLLLFCFTSLNAQTSSTQTITTAWGNYITTNIGGYGNTILQVRIAGQNSMWSGVFTVNGENSHTPDITWNNVKLISYSVYNADVDDIQAMIMSNTPGGFGGTEIVLKAGVPTIGSATITVTATGQNAAGLSLSGNSGSKPYTGTMATSAGTYNMWTVNNKVGIGTISPNEALHVLGNTKIEGGQIRFTTSYSDASGSTGILGNPNGWTRLDPNGGRFIITVPGEVANAGTNVLDIERVDTWQHLLELRANGGAYFGGPVGMGAANPEYRLHLHQTDFAPSDVIYPLMIDRGWFDNQGSSTPRSTGLAFKDVNSIEASIQAIRTASHANYLSDLSFSVNTTGSHNMSPAAALSEVMRITSAGNVGIGTSTPTSKLTVAGTIHSQKVKVTINAGADFVFEDDYDLKKLDDLQKFIQQHKHLPDFPSAKEMESKGIELGEMNIKLLQKIEELTLYILEQNKKVEKLLQEDAFNKKEIQKLKTKINANDEGF